MTDNGSSITKQKQTTMVNSHLDPHLPGGLDTFHLDAVEAAFFVLGHPPPFVAREFGGGGGKGQKGHEGQDGIRHFGFVFF